jgi:hypothetical protein
MTFLADRELRAVALADADGLHADGLILGKGPSSLEILLASAAWKPSVHTLRETWKARVRGRATPVLLVTLYDGKAAVVGPSGDHPPVYTDLEPSKLERICAAALDEPDRHAALRFLTSVLDELESSTAGLRNEGLFASHELETGVPAGVDWNEAGQHARPVLNLRDRELLKGQPIRNTLGCLRLITCSEGTERTKLDLDGAYAAWEIARADIYNEWAYATNPANLQPKIRPALKAAADLLRRYPPPEVTQDELVRLIESVEAPWGIRIEKQIRDSYGSLTGTDPHGWWTPTASWTKPFSPRMAGPLPSRMLRCWNTC